MRHLVLMTTALMLSWSSAGMAEDPRPIAIGTTAPDFDLPGVDGKNHRLAEYASAKVLVVAFTCNHCPTANAYEARFKSFARDYASKGVAFVAISPNDPKAVRPDELGYTDLDDSFESMKIRARDHEYNFPYLFDGENQKVSRAFGVLATPHIFIFDQSRKLCYQGRFDDAEVKTVKSHDAINAVEAILAGKKVPVETTRVPGCSTKWAEKRESAVKWLEKADAEPVSIETIDSEGVARLVKNDSDKLRVINLWATWCGPCVAELPELVEINRMYRGRKFQLVTLSIDEAKNKSAALDVLRKNHVAATNYLSGVEDQDKLANVLDKEWPGPVPYTLVVAPGGKVIFRKTGAVDPLELKRVIVGYLGRTY